MSNAKGSAEDTDVRVETTQESPSYGVATTPASTSALVSCSADQTLCDKIKLVGHFTDSETKIYESIIITQIHRIDTMLVTSQKIRDTLYTITLDKSDGNRR